MIYLIKNIRIDYNLYFFCKEYIKDNLYDRAYDNGRFLEYYPPQRFFKSNFKFEGICIGKMVTGNVTPHIDDDRLSAFIIPIYPLYIDLILDNEVLRCRNSFLLDTTKFHGADSKENSIFLALDFKKNFLEAKTHIRKNKILEIDISC